MTPYFLQIYFLLQLVESVHQSLEEKQNLYWELKTGAESGWDYSSRWFSNKNPTKKDTIGSLKDVKPRSIIPVDLNSILATNARTISMYYQDYLSDKEKGVKYKLYNPFFTKHLYVQLHFQLTKSCI